MRSREHIAVVVPDEETWLLSSGSADAQVRTTLEPTWATALLLPELVPDGLVDAAREAWSLLARGKELLTYPAELAGVPASHVVAQDHQPLDDTRHDHDGDEHGPHHDGGHDHGDHEQRGHGDDGHDHHDHHDMMAIVGEPSSDGLVMEDLDVEAGPLGLALPGGLVVAAKLDGDVVKECEVRPTLGQSDPRLPPDPRAAIAWSVAALVAREQAAGVAPPVEQCWLRLGAVEAERACAHLAWLHQLFRLMSWDVMVDRLRDALARLAPARRLLPIELPSPDLADVGDTELRDRLREGRDRCEALARGVGSSRVLRRRLLGLAGVSAADARRRALMGPAARASGLAVDSRAEDAAYRRLSFRPVVHSGGDALSRVLQRADEAVQAIDLALSALTCAHDRTHAPSFASAASAVVEGPRGPVRVAQRADGELERSAPGDRPALMAAGEAAVGREWAAALVAIASFDPSPWRATA